MNDRLDISLRISVTDRCDLACRYCSSGERVPLLPRDEILSFEEIIEVMRIIRRGFELRKVRITGGEPLMRRDIDHLVAMLAREEVPDLAMTTNGQRLAEHARALRSAGLHRVNISLDSLNHDRYRQMSGGELSRTLSGIEAARAAGLAPVKLNMVVLKDINDDEVVDMALFARTQDCQARFLELMPIGPASSRFEDWFVPACEVLRCLETRFDVKPLPARPDVAGRDFLLTDRTGRTGTIGVIAPCSMPFCDTCRRLRLTASGELLGCLAQAEGIDLRGMLRGPSGPRESAVLAAVATALRLKRSERRFAEQRRMVSIGG